MLANKAGLTILSGNIQSIKAKFDELEAFINRVNTSNPISLICLQECWLDEKNIESIAMFNLKEYNMSYQTKQCCGHGGLIIYVHTQFTCTPRGGSRMVGALRQMMWWGPLRRRPIA